LKKRPLGVVKWDTYEKNVRGPVVGHDKIVVSSSDMLVITAWKMGCGKHGRDGGVEGSRGIAADE